MFSFAPSPRRRLLLAALFLVAALPACSEHKPHEEEPTPEAPVHAQAAQTIEMGQWTDLLGTTQPLPNHSARISAAVEGHVLSVLRDDHELLREGQHVKAGQVVVRLDDRVLRANRDKLHAALNDLEEQKKQAGFALDLARIDVKRLKELAPPGANSSLLVSRIELEKALVLEKDAQSKLDAVATKRAANRADLAALDQQMEFYTLRAPIAGRLSLVQAVPGQTLTPGTIVADVMDLASIDVLCFAPPDTVALLNLDQPARLLRDKAGPADAEAVLAGKVAFVGVQAQPETGNTPVKVRFPNPELRLRANAIVRVQVLTLPEQKRLTVPESAVMEDLEVPTVLAVIDVKTEKGEHGPKQLGKVKKLNATLGIRDRAHNVVELLGLEDPVSKQKVDPAPLLFITEGGYGLHNDDVVKLEADEEKH